MAPTCSNCGASDFVWANELKTGTGLSGSSTLSLRPKGEIPLGTRVCRACGHAELFLRDISILHKPHLWKPGEFVPIQSKAVAKPAPAEPSHGHPSHTTHAMHDVTAPSPSLGPPPPPPHSPPMDPTPTRPPPPAIPPPPPSFPAGPPSYDPPASSPSLSEESGLAAHSPPMDPPERSADEPSKPKIPRRRSSKPKST